MHLVQILLPLSNNNGKKFSGKKFASVRKHLLDQYGGVTIYNRSPATGLWEDSDNELAADRVIIFEVMVTAIEINWWKQYRAKLEKQFQQDEIVIRSIAIEQM